MNFLVILGIAVGLAMDTFAVATATSVALRKVTGRQIFRFAFHFGLFQAAMPVIGWFAGRSVFGYISGWDHWLAFGLLSFVGGKALYEALWGDDEEAETSAPKQDPTCGASLVMLSVATSIDALAVGLSFAALNVQIWYPVAVIGLVTATLTTVGMLVGSRLGARFGRRVEILGGLILVAIGTNILIKHLYWS